MGKRMSAIEKNCNAILSSMLFLSSQVIETNDFDTLCK